MSGLEGLGTKVLATRKSFSAQCHEPTLVLRPLFRTRPALITRSNSKLPFSLTGEKAEGSRYCWRGAAAADGRAEVASLEVDSASVRGTGGEVGAGAGA